MNDTLKGLKPERFFYWFEKITKIPRGSYHEEKIADFLVHFAEERGLAYKRDEVNNVYIVIPATVGYEDEPSVLLQGHMDMVWAKDETATINLETDPLELVVSGNALKAKGTTLGADDGVALAAMLAVVDDKTVAHPELELLCTVQEEVGLVGIRKVNPAWIHSHRMINFDSGNSHEMCVCSAGTKKVSFGKTFREEKRSAVGLKLRLFGGLSGHAGLLCHKNRACCINIMGELLHLLEKEMPVYLSTITADGPAIHASCETFASVPEGCAQQAMQILQEQFKIIQKRYGASDPDLAFSVCEDPTKKQTLSTEDSDSVIRAMFLLHTGVRKSDENDLNIIVASSTFAAISLRNGLFKANYNIRSIEDSTRDLWYDRTGELLRMLGFEAVVDNEYPAWPRSETSVMQSRFAQEHKRLFGREIRRMYIHGGIEVSILFGMVPDMDAVGIMPTTVDFHTPNETMFIDEVQPFWDLLTAVLERKE